jgi:hypothetical protein
MHAMAANFIVQITHAILNEPLVKAMAKTEEIHNRQLNQGVIKLKILTNIRAVSKEQAKMKRTMRYRYSWMEGIIRFEA